MPDQPVSRRFASQQLDLHYADWGGEGLPTLILLHGGNDHCRSWDPLARALSDHFRIVAPDLRGHGDSDWSNDGNYSVNAHVHDLLALYRSLEIDRAAIVAHSFGGRVALRYAGLYPESVTRLVAIEGLVPPPAMEARWLSIPVEQRIREFHASLDRAWNATARPYASVEEAAERLREHNPRLEPAFALHLAEHATRLGEDGKRRWKFDLRVRSKSPIDISPEEGRRLYWHIAAPVLLVDGDESEYAGPADAPTLFRDARRLLVEGAGHWVQHDRFDAMLAACQDFLDR